MKPCESLVYAISLRELVSSSRRHDDGRCLGALREVALVNEGKMLIHAPENGLEQQPAPAGRKFYGIEKMFGLVPEQIGEVRSSRKCVCAVRWCTIKYSAPVNGAPFYNPPFPNQY